MRGLTLTQIFMYYFLLALPSICTFFVGESGAFSIRSFGLGEDGGGALIVVISDGLFW